MKYQRLNSLRLDGFDYSSDGYYFITIVTANRDMRLSTIENGQVVLTGDGEIVKFEWDGLVRRFPNIILDELVIMPDHIHGIIQVCEETAISGEQQISLSTIVQTFKSTTTRKINVLNRTPGQICWQRNYHDHIIRDDDDLYAIREYIKQNPVIWNDNQISQV